MTITAPLTKKTQHEVRNMLRKLIAAVVIVTALNTGAAWAVPAGARIFDFSNTTNFGVPGFGGQAGALSGSFTGSNGALTGFTGTFGGQAITNTVINVGSYTGSSGAWILGPINATFTVGGSTFQFGSSTILGAPPNYTMDGGMTQLSGGNQKSYQIYSVISAPEIDGGVLPVALFVIAGFGLLVLKNRSEVDNSATC